MQVKIISDGTSQGTKIIDENGNALENVSDIVWQADARTSLCTAFLTLVKVPIEVKVEANIHETDPLSQTGS